MEFFLRLLGCRRLLLILVESGGGDLVEPKDGLVGVLDEYVLALRHLHAHVDDRADYAPAVVEVQVHLRGEVARLEGYDAEDGVAVVVLGVRTGDESLTMKSISVLMDRERENTCG